MAGPDDKEGGAVLEDALENAAPASAGRQAVEPIKIQAGRLFELVDLAEAALVAHSAEGPIFQRGGRLVHVEQAKARRTDGSEELQERLADIHPALLRSYLSEAAAFEKFDKRSEAWVPADPPVPLVEAYAARGRWDLPAIAQLIGTPTLRHDGSLLWREGYDHKSGLYLVRELAGVDIPTDPTPRQAEAANEALAAIFRGFPYDDGARPGLGLAVALAGVLGAVLRPTLPAAPMIAVSAPEAGTGKSYLVDCIAMLATGARAPVAAIGHGDEEFEKALGANLLNGRPLLSLDNIVGPLGGALLCMAITQSSVEVRQLGANKTLRLPATTALFATGNNLRLRDDMSRRALICRLNARCEHPEERSFESDLLAEIAARRAELVKAALTIARWHHQRRDPAPCRGRQFAGFEEWCARVRDPLLALGHADPVEALELSRAADRGAEQFRAFALAWWEAFGDRRLTVADAIAASAATIAGDLQWPELRECLLGLASDGRTVQARRVGNYLSKQEGRVVDARAFQRAGVLHGNLLWQLAPS